MVPQYFQTSAEVAALLPDGVTVVDFASGEEQTAIWILRKGFAQVVRVPVGRDELAGLAAAATQPRFDEKSLRRIKQLVLDPVAELMPSGDLLVIVPDGPLHLVPFAAIPGFASRYLVQDHALVAAPSVGAWFHASEQLSARPRRRDRVTIAAEAAFDPAAFGSLPSLAFARGEARSVAAQYPSATTLFGKDVTHAAVVDAIASSEVFHFTGHALSNAYDAAASMLVVAGDTGVDSRDIRRIRSKGSSLVVLAACDSASGIMTQSDGPMGLARALLAAEVPSVVASRWLVLDRASRDLFATFHREYVRTGDAPTALAMAQREMIARDTVSSPYVWAGFVAFGGSLQHSLQ